MLALVFSQSATHGRTAAAAEVRDDVLESAAEIHVENSVQDRIDGRVGVAQPEQERIQPARKFGELLVVCADAASDVDREEAEPHGAEDADDGGHADCRSHLSSLAAISLTRSRSTRTRCMQSPAVVNVPRSSCD